VNRWRDATAPDIGDTFVQWIRVAASGLIN
jgi:hypothetical protein